MKRILISLLLLLPISCMAQKIFVEKAEGGAEKVIIEKLLENNYKVTFKADSADFIIRPNVKSMSFGRARGGLIIINAKSGDLIAKSSDFWGAAKMMNGYDNPTADVLKKISRKQLLKMVENILK